MTHPKSAARPNWNGWLVYNSRQAYFHKRRYTVNFNRALKYKNMMIKAYKKQSPYNKVYWKEMTLARLGYHLIFEAKHLNFARRAAAARQQIANAMKGEAKQNQLQLLQYQKNDIKFYTTRLQKTRADQKLFSRLYSNKKIKFSPYTRASLLHQKFYYLRAAAARVYIRYRDERNLLTNERRSYANNKKSKYAQNIARVYSAYIREFNSKTAQWSRKTTQEARNDAKALTDFYLILVGNYRRALPVYERQLKAYTALVKKYHYLAQHHPHNMNYRKLLFRYLALKKLSQYRVISSKNAIVTYQRDYNYYKKSRLLQQSTSNRAVERASTSISNTVSTNSSSSSSSFETVDGGKVETLTTYTATMLDNIMKFRNASDRKLLENCW